MTSRRFGRVLLTNDDGFDAPGIRLLAEIAARLADEVWVVAPERDRSGASACISLHDPLRAVERGPRQVAVAGTPADCVLMGVRHYMRENPPDLVLAGINAGANLADDVAFSGTTNAALTARFLGIPAIALSQVFTKRSQVRWETAAAWVPRALDLLLGAPDLPPFLNVNVPDLAAEAIQGFRVVRQGHGSILTVEVEARIDKREKPYFWFGFGREGRQPAPGTDVGAIADGYVAITPLGLDRTDHAALDRLSETIAPPTPVGNGARP